MKIRRTGHEQPIRNAILGRQKNNFSPEELGKLFEQWFKSQVITYNEYAQKNLMIHYYPPLSGTLKGRNTRQLS